ncbi:hypothetical protein [Sediminibacterium sp.]|uniref:hypothetical protein n=1 Tax=Sediminibacterium sp. TaxID=1917865 RepID=UPI003F6E8816
MERCIHEIIQTKDHQMYPFLYGKYALMTSDAIPENDIHIVFDCFKKMNEFPLVAITNWQANNYAKAIYAKYSTCKLIQLFDAKIELRLFNMLRSNCFVYIEANRKKNDLSQLLEAMYMQLPIISYASYDNQKTTNHQGWYYNNGNELKYILKSLHTTNTTKNGLLMKRIFNFQQEKLHLIH